jgi:dTDP-4-dehydrorhamnose 3,5-epimerase
MIYGNFQFEPTFIEGLILVKTKSFRDDRGSFSEVYNKQSFHAAGITDDFSQDNQSYSAKGTLRGLHIQCPNYQSKLVRVVSGRVYDVVVDLRKDSSTFGSYFGIELLSDGGMLYIPEGCAHGFLALEQSVFAYKCNNLYDPNGDVTIDFGCVEAPWKALAKAHSINQFIISHKDKQGMTIRGYQEKFLGP